MKSLVSWTLAILARVHPEVRSDEGSHTSHLEIISALRRPAPLRRAPLWIAAVAAFTMTLGLAPARAESLNALGSLAATSDPTDLRSDEAFLLRLQAHDLRALIKGLEQGFRRNPIQGRYDEPIFSEHPLGTLGVHGLHYSFRIAALDVLPAGGYLAATLRLEDVQVMVDRVTFDEEQTRWCTKLPLSSAGGAIPAYADATVVVDDRLVDLNVTRQGVGLDASNFRIGRPDHCEAVWGFNWLIRRVTPWLAGVIRDRIKESIAEAVVDVARRAVQSLNDMLQITITLPFSAKPAPDFYATVSVWPAAFEVDHDRVSFGMGADVVVDPDFLPRATAVRQLPSESWRQALGSALMPTYAAVRRAFLSSVLGEANRKGLLRFRVDPRRVPAAAVYLTTATIAGIIPDAAVRFAPDAAFALVAGGAATTGIRLEPQGPGGLPILVFELRGLRVDIEAAGRPYYELMVDLDVALQAGYDAATRQLTLGTTSVTAVARRHAFAAGLEPAPADANFDEEQFAQVIQRLSAIFEQESGRLIGIGVPDVVVGDRRLEFLGSELREDAVTVDGRIVDALP